MTLILVFLLPLAWLVTSIVLLAKPKTRVAGIVVLVAPLALVVIAGAFWWFSRPVAVDVATESEPAWQSHHVARTEIELDADHGPHRNVDISPPSSAEGDDPYVASEHVVVTPGGTVSYMKIGILLFALLFFGGLVAAIVMLAFPKTRLVGILLLAAGAVVVVVAFFGGIILYLYFEPMRVPARVSTLHDETKINSSIPVENEEKTEVKSTKPADSPPASAPRVAVGATAGKGKVLVAKAAKPPAATAAAAGHAPVKATTADEKKPATANTAAAPPPPSAPAKKPPAWINDPEQMLGDTYQMTIVVGPYATPQECNDELPAELQRALNRYVQGHVSQAAGARPIALPYDFLREEVVKGQWEELAPSSVGPMTRLYVLLQFDRKVRERILDQYRQNVVAGRLWIAGSGLAGLLWLLAVMYGYLTIDVKTGGLYRRRLRFAAVLAILGPVAAALLVAV
jgi:hypothetical protein